MEDTADSWKHKALCLEAEITARSAANVEYRERIDHLEDGIREARKQIEELKRELEFRRIAGNRASRNEVE